jgi:chromosomal replication initiation ATPase DnaA
MIQVQEAINVACDVVGIPVEQFTAPSRIEENCDARSIAYKLLYEHNEWGLERLGRIWDKDHSSIRWSIKRVDKSLDTRGVLGKLYKEAKKRIKYEKRDSMEVPS